MNRTTPALLVIGLLLGARALRAQAIANTPQEKAITAEMGQVRDTPDDKRPAYEAQIAAHIRALPPSLGRLSLAINLSSLVTEGDPGHATLQAVADTLTLALRDTPLPPEKDGSPASPYADLARLTHYEGATTTLDNPQFKKADAEYTANDADVEKLDFTLTDVHGKKWTLGQLRGKVVLVNFWATWCPPCRKEMPTLDALSRFYGSKLVVLSITSEALPIVNTFLQHPGYNTLQYPILLDPGHQVTDKFHVLGIPQTFVLDAHGKLAAHATDMRTQHQFQLMLTKAGLPPAK